MAAAYQAEVSEFQHARISGQGATVQGMQHQLEIAAGQSGRGQLQIKLQIGANGRPHHERKVVCGGS